MYNGLIILICSPLSEGGKAMGIFADQAKEMREERLAEIKKETKLQKEQHDIAQSIMDDFISDMNNEQLPNALPPSIQDNNVTIHAKARINSLIITCQGEDAFTVGRGQVLTKAMMARSVLVRLQTPQPNGDQWIEDES
jgi:hypothetical protein